MYFSKIIINSKTNQSFVYTLKLISYECMIYILNYSAINQSPQPILNILSTCYEINKIFLLRQYAKISMSVALILFYQHCLVHMEKTKTLNKQHLKSINQ